MNVTVAFAVVLLAALVVVASSFGLAIGWMALPDGPSPARPRGSPSVGSTA
jgi:hypothetical protein